MRIYISGPITGMDPIVTFITFNHAECKIQELGHIAVNPLKVGFHLPKDFRHQDFMDIDMAILKKMDAIVLLEGWECSKGCTQEFSYACRNDMKVYYDLDEIPVAK